MERVDELKNSLSLVIAGFILGAVLSFFVFAEQDKKLPEAIEIMVGKKMVGYANTDPETTEYVMVKNAKTPGMFIAFPIYGDNNKIKELLKGDESV